MGTKDGKLRQCMPKARQAMLALAVERNRCMGSVVETAVDEIRQHCARANLNKRAHASVVHSLNLLFKTHWSGNLSRQGFTHGFRQRGVERGRADWHRPAARGWPGECYPNRIWKGAAAGRTTGEWNAVETGNRRKRIPSCSKRLSALSMADVMPEITTCSGPL